MEPRRIIMRRNMPTAEQMREKAEAEAKKRVEVDAEIARERAMLESDKKKTIHFSDLEVGEEFSVLGGRARFTKVNSYTHTRMNHRGAIVTTRVTHPQLFIVRRINRPRNTARSHLATDNGIVEYAHSLRQANPGMSVDEALELAQHFRDRD